MVPEGIHTAASGTPPIATAMIVIAPLAYTTLSEPSLHFDNKG